MNFARLLGQTRALARLMGVKWLERRAGAWVSFWKKMVSDLIYSTVKLFPPLVLAIAVAGCQNTSLGDSAIKGRVLEKGTDKPIPDVIVAIVWQGDTHGSLGGGTTQCYHAAAATTDQDGVFEIPAWRRTKLEHVEKSIVERRRFVRAYKEGHDGFGRLEPKMEADGTIRIERRQNDIEWLEYSKPRGSPFACGFFDKSDKSLAPLLIRVCAERKVILQAQGKTDEKCVEPWKEILTAENKNELLKKFDDKKINI